MKTIRLNNQQVGLVFKNGAYQKMITEGRYWFWQKEEIFVYERTKSFVPPVALDILLQDAAMADLLEVVDVQNHQIALQFENGLLKAVLPAGRYPFWKSVIRTTFVLVDNSVVEIPDTIDRALLSKPLMSVWVRTYEIQTHEKALLFVDGGFVRQLGPGTYYWWKNSIPVLVAKADMRRQQLEINGQEMLTKDKAALRINAWAQYRVADLEKAMLQNKEYDKQLYVSFQLALRAYISGFGLDELLDKKEQIGPVVLEQLRGAAMALGIEVDQFGIRDIILPGDVKEIMNQVLVAEKKAQANTIMRREETASTRSLLNTAKLMEDNNMLWKLKEMEYVEKIADKISHISVNGNGLLVEQLRQIFVPPS